MEKFNIIVRELRGHPGMVVFDCHGLLDESTVEQLQAAIHHSLQKKQLKLLCNLTNLQQITSYAWGYLNGLREYVYAGHGDLQFYDNHSSANTAGSAPPAQPLFIFSDEKAALNYYQKQTIPSGKPYHFVFQLENYTAICGEPFPLKIEAYDRHDQLQVQYASAPHLIVDKGIISPALAYGMKNGVWEGIVVVTGPGKIRLRVWDENGYGEVYLETIQKGKRVKFPVDIACPGCQAENTVGKADVFRCIQCNEIYYVDAYAHVISLKPGEHSQVKLVKHIEFKIPGDVNYLNHIRNFIVGISSEEKISEEKIAQIEMSLDEALANVIEHAYAFDAYQEIHIQLSLFPDKLVIVLRDQGRSFDSDHTPLPDLKQHIEGRKVGGLGRYLIMTLMDEVEYHSDQQTNELRMVKRI